MFIVTSHGSKTLRVGFTDEEYAPGTVVDGVRYYTFDVVRDDVRMLAPIAVFPGEVTPDEGFGVAGPVIKEISPAGFDLCLRVTVGAPEGWRGHFRLNVLFAPTADVYYEVGS